MTKIEIIAEIAWGHNGDKKHLLNLLEGAKNGECDWVSIHITNMSDYMVTYYGQQQGSVSAGRNVSNVYEYLDKINISKKTWIEFNNRRIKLGLKLMVMPNDLNSLKFAVENLNPEAFVLSAASFSEDEMVVALAETKKRIFLRIGGSTISEIARVLSFFQSNDNNDIVLLHGVQNYPTDISNSFLKDLDKLNSVFGCATGIADHVDGDDPFAQILPLLAIPFGISFIEKHITLDRSKMDEDFEAAIEPHEFLQLKVNVSKTLLALSSSNLVSLPKSALDYRNVSRKKLILTEDVKQGDVIMRKHLIFKRSHYGIVIDDLVLVLGSRFNSDYVKNTTLTYDMISYE